MPSEPVVSSGQAEAWNWVLKVLRIFSRVTCLRDIEEDSIEDRRYVALSHAWGNRMRLFGGLWRRRLLRWPHGWRAFAYRHCQNRFRTRWFFAVILAFGLYGLTHYVFFRYSLQDLSIGDRVMLTSTGFWRWLEEPVIWVSVCTIGANVYETNQALLGHSPPLSVPWSYGLRQIVAVFRKQPTKSESLVSGRTLPITKGTEYTWFLGLGI